MMVRLCGKSLKNEGQVMQKSLRVMVLNRKLSGQPPDLG